MDGPFRVRSVARPRASSWPRVAHDRSAGELIAITPGRRRLTAFGRELGETGRVHRMHERTVDAPDGYPVHGWVTTPARPRTASGAPDRARRPVHAVRLVPVRRDTGLRLGRLRGRAVQPARLLRLRIRARAGDPGRGGGSTRPTSSPSSTPRSRIRRSTPAGSGSWAAPTAATSRPCSSGGRRVRRRDQRAGVHRPGELRRVLRHRVVLPRPLPRHRAGAHRRAEPAGLRRSDHHADPGHPLRGGLALSRRAGRAALRRAQASRRPDRAAAVPGEGHELSRTGRPRHRLARFEHILRWWARWLPTAENPARRAANCRRPPRTARRSRASRPAGNHSPCARPGWSEA